MGSEEEKLKEGLPTGATLKTAESNCSPIITFRQQAGTPTLRQLDSLASAFNPPETKGPWLGFMKEARALELPADYALTTWAYVASSIVAGRSLSSILGVEQRLTPAFLFAGDEIGMSRLLRDLAFEVLSECDGKTINSIHLAQTKDGLEYFECHDSIRVVDSGAGLDLKTWSRAPKGQIPLELLFDGVRLDRHLKTIIRAVDDVPAGVSVLAGIGLKELLSAAPEPKRLFGSFLAVPSLGRSGCQVRSGDELRPLRDQLIRLLPLSEVTECELKLSGGASEKWKEMLTNLNASIKERQSLGNEESAWHYRQISTPRNWLVFALAHAINRTFSHKGGFTGLLEAEDLEFAHKNLFLNHQAWDEIEDTYEKSQHVEEALWYLRLIVDDFSNCYSQDDGFISVGFGALRKKYCHHPGRDNKYSSREFHIHVLGELQRRGLAAPHPKLSRTWVFAKEMKPLALSSRPAVSMM